jgi:heat shock protein beta
MPDDAPTSTDEAPKGDDDLDIKDDDEKPDDKKTKTVHEKVMEWEHVNEAKALWLRPQSEVEEDEYKKFYQSMSKDYEDPMTWIHFKGEGDVDFTSILYIPKKASSNMWESNKADTMMKLYVRRVLITDNFEDMMPRYLNFVKGIVDSDDIPLNVNREQLQQLKLMKVIQRRLVRKVLEMIRKLAVAEDETMVENRDDMTDSEKADLDTKRDSRKKEMQETYVKFWEQFGKNVKLGVIEDAGNRNKLAKLTRFYSTHDKSALTSLDDYIDRAKKAQDSIYFLAGESKDAILNSPLLQGLVKKNYEVLLLDDPIDEYCMQHLSEYEKKKIVNVGKGDFKFPEDDEDKSKLKKLKKMYQPLTECLKNQYKDKVDNVNVSLKLVDDPMAVVSSENGFSASMERINKAQAFASKDRAGVFNTMKKTVEVNPYHPFIRELLERVKSEVDTETEEAAKLLFEVSLLNSGISPLTKDFLRLSIVRDY